MAYWYIDPDASGSNNGTSPANAWLGISNISGTSAGDTLYFKRGTTVSTVSTNQWYIPASLTFRAYSGTSGSASVEPEDDTTQPRPIIDAAASTAVNGCSVDSADCAFYSIHFKGPTVGNDVTAHTFRANSLCSNLIMEGCILEGQYIAAVSNVAGAGLYWLGSYPITLLGNEVHGTTTGIQLHQGDSIPTPSLSLIANNYIHDLQSHVDDEGLQLGLQLSVSAGVGAPLHNYQLIVRNNRIHDFKAEGLSCARAAEVLIEDNELISLNPNPKANSSGILLGSTLGDGGHSQIVRRNYFHIEDSASNGMGINTRGGYNSAIHNNIFESCAKAYSNSYAPSIDNIFYNNTVIDCIYGAYENNNLITVNGNIFTNMVTAPIYAASGATAEYANNQLHDKVVIGAGTLNDNGGNLTSDPLLDANHKPTTGSPCIGAGATPLDKRDFYGTYMKSLQADIGAVWFDGHEDSTYEKAIGGYGGISMAGNSTTQGTGVDTFELVENFDTNRPSSKVAPDYANGKLQVSVAGAYMVTASASISGGDASGPCTIEVRIDGAATGITAYSETGNWPAVLMASSPVFIPAFAAVTLQVKTLAAETLTISNAQLNVEWKG